MVERRLVKNSNCRYEYHLYKEGVHDDWYTIRKLMLLPFCVKMTSQKLQVRLNKAMNKNESTLLKTVWDCITVDEIDTTNTISRQARLDKVNSDTEIRDLWIKDMNLLKVSKTI